jgi:restriction system protein
MGNISKRRNGEMVQVLFDVLAEHPDGIPPRHAIGNTMARMEPTEFELGEYPSSPGKPRFHKILRFSTIGPVKAGWMTKSRTEGWQITDAGREARKEYADPQEFTRESDRLYRAWKKDQPDTDLVDEEVPENVPAATLEEAREQAWSEIEAYLRVMPPYDFQELVATLLEAMGYHIGWIAPPGPDRGIDIVAFTDPIGVEGPRIKVQVKRQSDTKMSVSDIRSFVAVLGDRDAGIYVSAGGFTRDALVEARMLETRRLTLIDLEQLVELWTVHYGSLGDSGKRLLPLNAVHFLASEG